VTIALAIIGIMLGITILCLAMRVNQWKGRNGELIDRFEKFEADTEIIHTEWHNTEKDNRKLNAHNEQLQMKIDKLRQNIRGICSQVEQLQVSNSAWRNKQMSEDKRCKLIGTMLDKPHPKGHVTTDKVVDNEARKAKAL